MTHYSNLEAEQSADAIKADIERTRSQMGYKIDEIQDRFRPEQLKDQAQEVVRSAVQDSTEAVVSYVRTHSAELSGALMDTVKRNPVPAAMIGLGLGWILYDSLTNRSSYDASSDRFYRYGGYQGGKAAGYRGEYSGRYGAQYDSGYSGQSGVPYGGYRGSEYGGQGQYGSQYSSEAWRGQEGQGSGMTAQMRDKMNEARDKVGEATHQVTDQIRDATDRLQEMGSQVGHQVSDYTEQARHQVGELTEQARHQMQRVGSQAYDLIEENPFAVGLVALGVGVALGMALPSTRRENRIMGEWRDQALERARQTADEVSHRVQEVVEEVRPELEQTASKVVDDLTRTGKQAAEEVKESVKKATKHSPESSSTATEATDLETDSAASRTS
jgi:ElaB/YqjD/DUF883 family membrane-anchored ribosome-binding protein